MKASFEAPLACFPGDLWGHHFPVPVDIGEEFLANDAKRVVATLNGKLEYQCAIMKGKNHLFFININKKNRDKLGIVLGQPVQIQLVKDESEYGLPMPDEFREMLNQDPEGDRLFHALTPGRQRNLLYIAGNVKNVDKRIERAYVIVEHLKIHGGKVEFKALQEEMKAYRNRAF